MFPDHVSSLLPLAEWGFIEGEKLLVQMIGRQHCVRLAI